MKRKNKSVAAPFTPRAGMRFMANGRRSNRNGRLADKFIELVEPLFNGRVWISRDVDTQHKMRVLAAKLHSGPYHDGWSLIKPENALPENWGQVADISSRLTEEQIQVLENIFPKNRD